ncbi:MAG TPA: hypothetical protein VGE18_02120 [Candidatus Paceibacterota bacterium]
MKLSRLLFVIALGILACRIVYLLLWPSAFAWDAAVYVGMGRYIESFGSLGFWEVYRPPLLPLLFSFGALFGIPIAWAIGLTIFASFGALYVAYKVGEQYMPTAGGWAAVVLASATLFNTFSTLPTTEVFGVLGFFIVFYILFIKRAYVWGGVVTAVMLLLRFPYGLLIPLFGIALAVQAWIETKHISVVIKRGMHFSLGALLILATYLISNIFLFGGALMPITEGARVAHEVSFLYREHALFYVGVLVLGAPLVIFSLIPFFFYKKNEQTKNIVIGILAFVAVSFFLYFSMEEHKEPRYIMPAFAPLALLAGLGIATLFSRTKTLTRTVLVSAVSILAVAGFFLMLHANIGFGKNKILEEYYKSFREYPGATVLSTHPSIAAFAPVRLIGSFETTAKYLIAFDSNENDIDFLYFNSCDLLQCQAGGSCGAETALLLDTLAPKVNFTAIANHGSCQVLIGEVK